MEETASGPGPGPGHGLGYQGVDGDPEPPVLLDAMDATGRWEATVRLRAWERATLGLRAGERLLDVGCGLGDSALGLAADLGPNGEVVGLDASSAMIDTARARAHRSARCPVRFVVGDAHDLGEPDAAFDAVRSERTLQWLTRPDVAVAEMVRVLRPGGRLSLIDTDWSSFTLDIGDEALGSCVHDAMRVERNRPSNIGARLHDLAGTAGLRVIGRNSATQVWTDWDPDQRPAPDGCFSMASLAEDLVELGLLAAGGHGGFVSAVHDAARAGRFRMSLTMHAVVAAAQC